MYPTLYGIPQNVSVGQMWSSHCEVSPTSGLASAEPAARAAMVADKTIRPVRNIHSPHASAESIRLARAATLRRLVAAFQPVLGLPNLHERASAFGMSANLLERPNLGRIAVTTRRRGQNGGRGPIADIHLWA